MRTRTWFDPHLPDIQVGAAMRRAIGGKYKLQPDIYEDPPLVVHGIPLVAAFVRQRDRVGAPGDRRIRIGYYSPPRELGQLMRGGSAIGSGFLYREPELRRDWEINFQRAGIYQDEIIEIYNPREPNDPDIAQQHPSPHMVTVYWTRIISALISQIEAGRDLPRRSLAWLDRLELAPGYTNSGARAEDARLRRL
jgi:hypothetical protein|tara:strand:+ start:1512 stop:2093 length:582 start_codon:yes stop_codon:yes gene_type:complete